MRKLLFYRLLERPQNKAKPTTEENSDFIILHTGTNNLRSNADPEEIANIIVGVAVSCKENDSEVVFSPYYRDKAILMRKEHCT